jgi:hypothetical protein
VDLDAISYQLSVAGMAALWAAHLVKSALLGECGHEMQEGPALRAGPSQVLIADS